MQRLQTKVSKSKYQTKLDSEVLKSGLKLLTHASISTKSTPNSEICQIHFHHCVQNTQKPWNRLQDYQNLTPIHWSMKETILAVWLTEFQTVLVMSLVCCSVLKLQNLYHFVNVRSKISSHFSWCLVLHTKHQILINLLSSPFQWQWRVLSSSNEPKQIGSPRNL